MSTWERLRYGLAGLYGRLEEKTPAAIKGAIPAQWRVTLGALIKDGARPWPVMPRPLALPAGESEASLRAFLAAHRLEDQLVGDELAGYLNEAFRRFLYTLELVPRGTGRLLEIGANPYFMSLLLRRHTTYDLTFTNYFGPEWGESATQAAIGPEGRVPFTFHNVNVEQMPLPFAEGAFEVVLLCEVLEHFTNDPLYALRNVRRVLAPDGHLVLTTPNVNRLANVARLFAGQNIYDPYSGYGAYGRHNREYNRRELAALLAHAGFTVEEMFSADVHPEPGILMGNPGWLPGLLRARKGDLGQYLFVRARSGARVQQGKPRWLYRSYPEAELT